MTAFRPVFSRYSASNDAEPLKNKPLKVCFLPLGEDFLDEFLFVRTEARNYSANLVRNFIMTLLF